MKRKTLVWNPQRGGRRGRPKEVWKRQFCRKQENEAEHGAKLRDWRVIESLRYALQTPYFLNGTKGYSTTNNSRKQVQNLGRNPQI